jgi:penicillin-binding protein 2
MERIYSNRKFIVIGLFLLVGLAYVIRLFFIQIVADKYVLSANNNVLRYVTQYPARGLVYDRNGKLLVFNEAAYDLMVIPRQVKNIDTAELCRLLEIDKEEFIKRVATARNYSPYRPSIFESQITRENYGYLEEKMFRFPGFFVQPRTLRKYTYPIAAHTLGYIGEVDQDIIDNNSYYKSGDYVGISGLEKSYEELLRGKKGMKIRVVDVLNRDKGSFQGGKYDTIAYAGTDLYSSLDADLQVYGEMLMNGKKGSIVALEPSTGEILCMVSAPSYDPNLLVGRIRKSNYYKLLKDSILVPLFNRALMASYPSGSTFKTVEALVGQQVGVLTPDTKYSCPGGFPLGNGKKVACHNHYSPLDLRQSIQHSCNTYYCRVFKSIIDKHPFTSTRDGYEVWRNLVMSFGFGHKFGIDLPGEMNGNIPSSNYYDKYHGKNRWTSMAIISLGIGQGEIGITPLQLANQAAIISNRGFYYTPHIARAIGTKTNMNPAFKEKHYCNVDPQYFPIVIEGMHDVFEPGGTGFESRVEGIEMCGKTGTAQNPHGKNHSIFIAFAPKDNPKIAVAVVVENAGFGATYAAPIASLIIEKYLTGQIKRKNIEQNMINGTVIHEGKVIDQ